MSNFYELAKQQIPDSSSQLRFYVNSKLSVIDSVDCKTTILQYLRENGLTGAKRGCSEGGCGACTVVIAEYDAEKNMVKYKSANSCITPLCALNNKQVITVEGLGNLESPHPIQERIANGHGTQCGFCTTGIVMSFYSFLKLNPTPSMGDIEDSLDGNNLCRCTGYRPIMQSLKSFAPDGEKKTSLFDFTAYRSYDPAADLPFPESLANNESKPLVTSKDGLTWCEPTSLTQLLELKTNYPDARLIGGNSEVGYDLQLRAADYKHFINVSRVKELKQVSVEGDNIEIGASVCLSDLSDRLKELKCDSSLVQSLLSTLKYFATKQIRNFATIGGNILTNVNQSDLLPVLIANRASLVILSKSKGVRTTTSDEISLGVDEVLIKIVIPLPNEREYVKSYRQYKRKQLSGCFRVKLDSENKIERLGVSFNEGPINLNQLSDKFKGAVWSQSLSLIQDELVQQLSKEFKAEKDGSGHFKRVLAVSYFTRFWFEVCKHFNIATGLGGDLLSNVEEIEQITGKDQNGIFKAIQNVGEVDLNNNKPDEGNYCVGSTNAHASGLNHACGTAKYLDDIPAYRGELFAGLVLSKKSRAAIKRIDASKALSLPGVVEFVSHKDATENLFGMEKDEEIFASSRVHFHGQLIGMVLAENRRLAKEAARLVEVEYEETEDDKPILNIRQAIERNSFFEWNRVFQKGEFDDQTFNTEGTDDVIVEGEIEMGGQEHFYLETQGCLVVPKIEDNEYEVYASSQAPNSIQTEVSRTVGVPANRVSVRIKRVGGGFGGKETDSARVAIATSVAAKKSGRPVRCVLERHEDMLKTGKRHAYYAKYKVRISRDGLFKAYDLELFNNGGFSLDYSPSIMEQTIYRGLDNAYMFPKLRATAKLAKTNTPSNTAFRGFGAPQGMFITESMIYEAAQQLGMDPYILREKNFYKENDLSHCSFPIIDWYVPEMWHELKESECFEAKRKAIEQFNKDNRWKKRGIALIPTKFPLTMANFLHQGSAIVQILTDGSVQLTHGGVEMGQGLFTKLIQVAANILKVPPSQIHTKHTTTETVVNASTSGGSMTFDLNSIAIKNACQELYERLKPFREQIPNGSLADWAKAAYFSKVSLIAAGYFRAHDLDYDEKTNTGSMFFYCTNGVAMSLVELDVLTGEHVTLESSVYMDIGNSVNYGIDMGQVEGAFMQGVGWCTTEELRVNTKTGEQLSVGPRSYRLPGFRDQPRQFTVKFLRGKEYKQPKTFGWSKGLGEPPFFLGASVFYALREAVIAARVENNKSPKLIGFSSPCTPEVLRLACGDIIVEKADSLPKEEPWSVRT